MTALDSITSENPKVIYAALARIIDIANKGSVITKDHAVNILIKLAFVNQYAEEAFILLIDQLKNCATNQLPTLPKMQCQSSTIKTKLFLLKRYVQGLMILKKKQNECAWRK